MTGGQYDAFFDELDSDKQASFESRMCVNILRGLGFTHVEIASLRSEASAYATQVTGFTPEWISDRIACPMTFRAVADRRISDCVPTFEHLVMRGWPNSKRAGRAFEAIWSETVDRFGSGILCVGFRIMAVRDIVVLHNDVPASWLPGLRLFSGCELWIQSLDNVLKNLLRRWQPRK